MQPEGKYQGLLRHLYAQLPHFGLLYTALVLSLLLIGVSAARSWLGLYLLSGFAFLVLGYYFIAGLWAAHRLYDRDELQPHHVLFDMSQLKENGRFLYINLGLRQRAIQLGRRLTTGQAIVVDVYNPQLTPSSAVKRARTRRPTPPPDPRFEWLDGSIDLLPLPDESVPVVFLCQVLSEFWQPGDRRELLQEVYRVLPQNGRLLIAEQVRTRNNWIIRGPGGFSLETASYWRQLLSEAGFIVRREQSLDGLITCFRAEKPTFAEARQLALALNYETI